MKNILILVLSILVFSCSSSKTNNKNKSNYEYEEYKINSEDELSDDFQIIKIDDDFSNYLEEIDEFEEALSNKSRRYYYKKNRRVYKICIDQDGKVLVTPNGQRITYGKGYKVKDIKSRYGLGKYYARSLSKSSCRYF
ncbi:hypothetical protein [Winogradskyella sp.]|uniref:hypothetical protein n=1 Tax=Winogradskyella sp. TaxID=1883156 RepID=UPI003BA9F121